MNTLVVATRNRGKIREIQSLLNGLVTTVICSADIDGFPDTIEDGATFEENALKKAREASRFTGLPALADDSGLVVDALAGKPGVHSARFAGADACDADNNSLLLQQLETVAGDCRHASFVCVLAFVSPDGEEHLFTGSVPGRILNTPQGTDGFGYDPLFLVNGYDRTMAELALSEKNKVSHRGRAFRQFLDFCRNRCAARAGEAQGNRPGCMQPGEDRGDHP